ncbi:MAG: response regulator [Chloroflexi bacterium]|nr:response regulator [Chloroflexota bacterium]
MRARDRAAIDLDALPVRELEELRRGLLPLYISALVGIVLVWGAFQSWRPLINWLVDGAVLTAGLASIIAYRLRRYHAAASWVFILGLTLAGSLVVVALPNPLVIAFGAVVVVVALALLDAWQGFVAGLVAWGTAATAWNLATGSTGLGEDVLLVGALYALTWGVTCVAQRALHRSAEIALTGWSQLRAALLETREHRAELYRVVRALEEATYRIERMNNELILAQHAAEAARASKARFAAIVSHELRGSLNLILGFSRLMALSPENYPAPLPAAYRADVDTIYESSQHVVSLLDDILDLSQIEVDRMPLVKDLVDLEGDVIDDVVSMVRPLASRRGLSLRLELEGNLPPVFADRARLRQVLLNLLTNAVRFTDRGGITVRTASRGVQDSIQDRDTLLVSVQDTGRGIPPEQMPKLFEEFQQLHWGDQRDRQGTGLGLAISKHIVELLGGRIWAESTEGVGTTLYFTLPRSAEASMSPSAVRGPARSRAASSHDTCLVLHDDPFAVKLFARHIPGYRMVGVPGEQEALALTQELQPRAVITSSEGGERIVSQLAAASLDVPVLSCDLPHILNGPARAGVEGALTYLMKPVTPEMVQAVMRQVGQDRDMTLLLVDDEPDAVRLLESMLKSLLRPYRILRAYSGVQALEMMRDTTPDVVFMDLRMPEMDGQQAIVEMRADIRLHGIPVVIVSAQDAGEHAVALGTSIWLRHQRPIDAARGARYLKAILDVLSPSYLPDPTAPGLPAEAAAR